MTHLIACLSIEEKNEKNLAHVSKLIKVEPWDKIILITNNIGKNNFKSEKEVEFIVVDFQKPVLDLIEDIRNGLKGKISDFEVALNLVSGSGKEHMAILSALLKLGVGIRLMAITKEGIKEL